MSYRHLESPSPSSTSSSGSDVTRLYLPHDEADEEEELHKLHERIQAEQAVVPEGMQYAVEVLQRLAAMLAARVPLESFEAALEHELETTPREMTYAQQMLSRIMQP